MAVVDLLSTRYLFSSEITARDFSFFGEVCSHSIVFDFSTPCFSIVFVGVSNLRLNPSEFSSKAKVFQPETIIVHENYTFDHTKKHENFDYDVALVYLFFVLRDFAQIWLVNFSQKMLVRGGLRSRSQGTGAGHFAWSRSRSSN